jgi:ketosteroid isomerase-like protein
MSSSNVEIARRATDAFNHRGIDAWLGQVDADIVWYVFPDEPDPGPFRGREAVRALAARWMDLFSDLRFEVKEYIDVGDYVLVPARVVGRMPGSDTDVGIDEVFVNKCRNGRIVEVREFRTKEEALETVAGSEQASAESS